MKAKNNGFRKSSISATIQDAFDLKVLCEKDKAQLIEAGLPWSRYDELIEATNELTALNRKLLLYREDCKCEVASLRKFAQKCHKFRSKLRQTLIFALELAQWELKMPGLSSRKAYIDISQDLLELAVLAEKFVAKEPRFFTETGLILKARKDSDSLLKMMSRKELFFNDSKKAKKKCLDSHQSLSKIMKVIRTAGKKAFLDNPGKRAAYMVK